MNLFAALLIVCALTALALIGVGAANLEFLFGVIIPYAGISIFLIGLIYRVIHWAKSPVPFRIPTTCGQQKSLTWIKSNNLESPYNIWGVIGRMFLEIFFFRSLFRNTRAEVKEGPKIIYSASKWLWAAGLAFHWSFLVVIIRHFRFFIEPVPQIISNIESLDGFFQIGLPILYITDLILVGALGYLFFRRVVIPQVRYISLVADYLALFLLGAIVTSGICLRYYDKTDIVGIKELATNLLNLTPVIPEGIGVTFYIHLFLVSCLLMYFPFSKLMHMGGVFLSPTRNLANNNRVKRHINPWNHDVKLHTYAEYEEEFHDVMKAAGLPLEKE
ncbi:MAG: sulfate reduction electron transfer complex DsrMKJOP subunit DsrM [bacterium]